MSIDPFIQPNADLNETDGVMELIQTSIPFDVPPQMVNPSKIATEGRNTLVNKSVGRESSGSINNDYLLNIEPISTSRLIKMTESKEMPLGSTMEIQGVQSHASRDSKTPKKIVFVSSLNKMALAHKL